LKKAAVDMDTKIEKAKNNLEGKEGVKLRTARKKLKRLQRRKARELTSVKRAEARAKSKKKPETAQAAPAQAAPAEVKPPKEEKPAE